MKDLKRLTIANFNCTFGLDDKPMMEYFDNIIYPAFKSDIIREQKDTSYFFDEVKIMEYEKDKFILVGLLIKSTTLEIKSEYIKGTGIKKVNKRYGSDPFSIFIIFLENHRMILVKNQSKGSPDIRSFSATASYFLKDYIHSQNKYKEKKDKLPFAKLNVVSIPSKEDIVKKLEGVNKIEKVTFRLYPANGDIPINGAYNSLLEQLDMIGSKTGNVNYNSPTKKTKVAELITETRGLVDPSLKVKYKNGGKGTIRNESFSESIDIEISEDAELKDNVYEIMDIMSENKDLHEVSENNKIIYLDNIKKVKNLNNK
ncbi:hypothetical protein [Clostridium botulinum]|uniref:hypothetical protein n=1 Tax=Clostridium botulinum TaxID=1491 RepID=UPI0013F0E67F|nr:hypothetical protein [Clostridium botulinum]MBY6950365.1 hypothetical protein [Clostridium botulinum]MCR1138615.1 hypothetical protein [Clostridium botulinum]NEZ80835.1 hypothetical protein [Clostridium botulinum]NFA16653.1 hypothetical protein [Clostridium botulinum]NFA54776.1 hypothetical protein [Clostridium botulinum]